MELSSASGTSEALAPGGVPGTATASWKTGSSKTADSGVRGEDGNGNGDNGGGATAENLPGTRAESCPSQLSAYLPPLCGVLERARWRLASGTAAKRSAADSCGSFLMTTASVVEAMSMSPAVTAAPGALVPDDSEAMQTNRELCPRKLGYGCERQKTSLVASKWRSEYGGTRFQDEYGRMSKCECA